MDQSNDAYKHPQSLSVLTGKMPRSATAAKRLAEPQERAREQPEADAETDNETKRIAARREYVNVELPADAQKPWGLALSGGGIRSATFSLGVLQALAQAPINDKYRSLARFDYLSTVSGGGYVGSFLVSLFMKNRLAEKTDEKAAAINASNVLRTNPPVRLRRTDMGGDSAKQAKAKPVDAAQFSLSWLRENGRYLTPNGAGDVFFAAAVGIRNFCAVHYVIATVVFTAFFISQALQATLLSHVQDTIFQSTISAHFSPPSAPAATCENVVKVAVDAATTMKATVVPDPSCAKPPTRAVWWSMLWVPALVIFTLVTVPVAVAYWIVHPRKGGSIADPPEFFSTGAWGYFAVIVALSGIVFWQMQVVFSTSVSDWTVLIFTLVAAILWCSIALLVHGCAVIAVRFAASAGSNANTVAQERRRLSLWLEKTLLWAGCAAVLAALETLAQTFYLHASASTHSTVAITTATYGALAWLTHKLIVFFNEKSTNALIKKLPLPMLVNLLGIVVALALVCFWAYLAVATRYPAGTGAAPTPLPLLGGLLAFTVGTAMLSGLFPGFVNLSTWHAFYSTRLRRAYLGATNRARFNDPSLSVVETHKGDEPKASDYRAASGAPLHLINVCVNQTMGAGGQLVQRDRKGKNLCIGPFGYTIDDKFFRFPPRGDSADVSPDLAISEWVGVSGAAFSTGLGRQSSIGSSLLLGFANVRLGRWWPSYASTERKSDDSRAIHLWRGLLQSQAYLFRELTARFPGNDREWLYLSDGGHFENTALYELLRPVRGVRLVVVCDNGCDEKYEFNDLANAIRLARIDHGVEIAVDSDAMKLPALAPHLATPAELRAAQVSEAVSGKRSDRCAVLLKATHTDWPDLQTRILLIKPRLIAALPEDVLEYAQTHPDFPQQTTSDQFFDEAQWESYRKLGLCVGNVLFGDDKQASAFWIQLQRYVAG